jgi:hypothetical protein
MNEKSPPLKVWIYSISIVILIILFFKIVPRNDKSQEFEGPQNKLRTAIIKNNKPDSTATSIVFLGSSLSECAFNNSSSFEKKLSKNEKHKSRVLKVVIHSLNNKIIRELRFFDFITKSPPDYLFIESNNININEDGPGEKFKFLASSIENMISYSRSAIRIHKNYNFSPEAASHSSKFYKDNFDTIAYAKLLLKKRFVRSFSQNRIANKAYAELIKNNTKIIFLDMPRASKFESVWLNKNQKKEYNALLQTYNQKYGIECWQYPTSFNDSDFIDGAHLNYKGAKKYEEWFVNKFNLLRWK